MHVAYQIESINYIIFLQIFGRTLESVTTLNAEELFEHCGNCLVNFHII